MTTNNNNPFTIIKDFVQGNEKVKRTMDIFEES